MNVTDYMKGNLRKIVSNGITVSMSEFALASFPGHNFDPRTRIFTEDELKPQPMIKKSKKQVSIVSRRKNIYRIFYSFSCLPYIYSFY